MVNEYDALAKKYIGDDYDSLSTHEQLNYVIENLGLPSIMTKNLVSGGKKLNEEYARRITYDLLKARDTISKVKDKGLEDFLK